MGSSTVTGITSTRIDGARPALDTAPIIYYVEQHDRYVPLLYTFFEQIAHGGLPAYSSLVTPNETFMHPRRTGNTKIMSAFQRGRLDSKNLSLATALTAGCEAFLPNDFDLRRPDVRSIVVFRS